MRLSENWTCQRKEIVKMIYISKGEVNKWLVCLGLAVFVAGLFASSAMAKVTVTYWEKWSGFEKKAMGEIVDDFNASQNEIKVKFLSVAGIDVKTKTAIAGGNPPDVVGLWSYSVVPFAMNNALIPLDDYMKEAGIKEESYISSIWDLMYAQGKVWALPSTPATMGYHYNKGMFQDAGLDPDKPPLTIAELNLYNEKLTQMDAEGNIIQMGFDPGWPGWFKYPWGWFFGGELYDAETQTITADDPNNIAAYEWINALAEKYGRTNLMSFKSGYGGFGSPTNPFLAGKLAAVLQGVWEANFIQTYASDMDWGVAAFPYGPNGKPDTTWVEADVLAIPTGAKHPDEAFEFIKYVQTQAAMEKLCLAQKKLTSLLATYNNPDFINNHPNPYIKFFFEQAMSPNAKIAPRVPIWSFYDKYMQVAFDNIIIGEVTPADALKEVTTTVQQELDKYKGMF